MERGKIVQRGAAREPDEEENMYNYDPSESEDEFGKAEKILIDNRRGTKKEAQESEEVVIEPDLVGAQCGFDDAEMGDEIFPRKWPRTLQLSLINSVRLHYYKFDSINYTHKAVWDIIAREIGVPLNHKLLSMKWRNLKRTYRHIRDNKKPGTIKWEYYQLIDEILGNRPDVVPPHRYARPALVVHTPEVVPSTSTQETGNVEMVEESGDQPVMSPEPSSPVKRMLPISDHLEFRAERDAFLEKRRARKDEYRRAALEFKMKAHKEKMEALRGLTSVLDKIAEKLIK